jgi:acyl-CoA dehydrogenase
MCGWASNAMAIAMRGMVRIADGPDEAHLERLGKRENRRAMEAAQLIQRQMDLTEALFKKWNVQESGPCLRL